MDSEIFHKLCESAFDFLRRSAKEIESEPKHALVSFAAGVELILKARLLHEHWSLIVVGKPDQKKFKKGDFNSVGAGDALDRLELIVGDPAPKEAIAAFNQIIKHRNSVVHFFHELEGDKFRQAAARDMCLGWMYLRALLTAWAPKFDAFKDRVRLTDTAMKKVKGFLAAVFESVKPELDSLRKKSVEIAICPSCSFEAAPVASVSGPISVQTCKVCGLSINRLSFECPECGSEHTFNGWDQFQPIQCECGEAISQEDVKKALDESDPSEGQHPNCGNCTSAGTVVWHEGMYICIECASYSETVAQCEWCSEYQLNGGDLEFSYFSGCEFCDGRGVDDD
ncbi:hypothetical protein RLW55_16785 [Hyphomicrobium sp. B1]|uniref:hypothetical protein n=1 Tax=Hyphomicrobium sp. B1 TaxID=3075651 RepID=UPI003C2CD0E1